jgi:hypothetical protein
MQFKPNLLLYIAAAWLVGCQTFSRSRTASGVSLVTDSAAITVYHRGIGYMTDIGFTLSNNSGKPISRAGCGGPGWPDIEKKVDGRWTPAFYQIYLLCRRIPDFSWDTGAQVHDVLHFGAVEKGHHVGPELLVTSIDGIYRLRWTFTEGRVADAKGARRITTTSNEFRMTLASPSEPASNTR